MAKNEKYAESSIHIQTARAFTAEKTNKNLTNFQWIECMDYYILLSNRIISFLGFKLKGKIIRINRHKT